MISFVANCDTTFSVFVIFEGTESFVRKKIKLSKQHKLVHFRQMYSFTKTVFIYTIYMYVYMYSQKLFLFMSVHIR